MAAICVVGDLVTDVIVRSRGSLAPGADTPATIDVVRGGSGANVAVVLSNLGHEVRFVGSVGNDTRGDALVAAMRIAGVELDVERNGASGTVVALVDVDGERSFLTDRRAAPDRGPIDHAVLEGIDLLHVSGYSVVEGGFADATRSLIGEAIAAGIDRSIAMPTTSVVEDFGPQHFQALVEAAAPTVLVGNKPEIDMLYGAENSAPFGTTFVTDGSHQTQIRRPGEAMMLVEPPPVADVIDTTGAGDAFTAGLLSAILSGCDASAAVAAGHGSASEATRRPGALQGGTTISRDTR